MAIIPETIYRLVDKKLRDRHTLVPRAEMDLLAAQSAAVSCSAPPMDADRVSGSGDGKRLEKAVLRVIAAEKALHDAREWLAVIRLLDAAFPFPGTVEGEIANILYERGENMTQACGRLKCDRQTVRRRKDNYVIYGALIAASKGLIQIGGEIIGRQDEN